MKSNPKPYNGAKGVDNEGVPTNHFVFIGVPLSNSLLESSSYMKGVWDMIKTKNYTILVFIMVLSALLFAACWHTSDSDKDNIVEIIVADDRFDTLEIAVITAELDDDLAGDGPFTVFAPTDDAFDLLGAGTIASLLETANRAVLINILTYHVYEGAVEAADAIALDGTAVEMLNTANLRFDVVGTDLILNLNGVREALVIETNINASNGIIHVIDAVLDPDDAPLDIIQTASASAEFNTLVTAIVAAGLDDDLAAPGPFTVFAPTDDAFNAIDAGALAALLASPTALSNVLLYHVYDGSVLSDAVPALDGSSVMMLNGDDLSFDVNGGIFLNFGTPSQAEVIDIDILCSNGVIHVIDAVLDPADAPAP